MASVLITSHRNLTIASFERYHSEKLVLWT